MRRLEPTLAALMAAALMSACATRLEPASTPGAPPAATPSPAAAATPVPPPAAASAPVTLAGEQLRLSELFRGTPVSFAMRQDGSLRATVPLRYSFDPGASVVKPPLAAVLDRIAKSQLQSASRLRVLAPADPGPRSTRTSALANARALGVREHLVAQGIAAARVQAGPGKAAEQVEIVVTDAAR